MAWDLALDYKTRDLRAGIITGRDEILQRLETRLKRQLGEWFLNITVGLPWYAEDLNAPNPGYGYGLLGSRDKNRMDLLIRRETLGTLGVNRIVRFRSTFANDNRQFNIYMKIIIETEELVTFTLTEEGLTIWPE